MIQTFIVGVSQLVSEWVSELVCNVYGCVYFAFSFSHSVIHVDSFVRLTLCAFFPISYFCFSRFICETTTTDTKKHSSFAHSYFFFLFVGGFVQRFITKLGQHKDLYFSTFLFVDVMRVVFVCNFILVDDIFCFSAFQNVYCLRALRRLYLSIYVCMCFASHSAFRCYSCSICSLVRIKRAKGNENIYILSLPYCRIYALTIWCVRKYTYTSA